jgi:undecaprenyl pyrophosphate synthase
MAFFSKKKDEQIEVTDLNLPSHIGIIMDGNVGQRKEDFREKQVTVRVLKLSEP